MNSKIKTMLVNATNSKYKAEMDDAIARLAIYLTNPVAIGEHPQHTEEIDKLVEQYANASDKLEAFKIMVKQIEE